MSKTPPGVPNGIFVPKRCDNGECTILSRSSKFKVRIETLDTLESLRESSRSGLDWACLFVLPFWLQTVWRHLGCRGEPCILSVADGPHVIGIATLSIDDHTAFFLGNPEVCDYQDIITVPGREMEVMAAVAAHLKAMDVQRMDLETLRPDALAIKAVRALERQNNWIIALQPAEVTYEASLPASWDDYLMQLNGKQRHEVRRKMRRLENSGAFAYRMADDNENLADATEHFLRLFHLNRADKAEFMNESMSGYFRELIGALAGQQMLRLYFLEMEGNPAATVLCFDYNRVRYLYNSGYDAHYHDFSVGVLSKVLSIQTGIEAGCRRYDFLKGAETYKRHLGGYEVPLYRCLITF
jgi:CelD/BcsL family acetyltransferase involved in cellulose biosynthesis